MYPEYKLQVYDYVQKAWIDAPGVEASNRPHHYDDVLRPAYERLIYGATEGASPNQQPIGYRIVVRGNEPVDVWTNGKVPS
jgi:hypothetical protein